MSNITIHFILSILIASVFLGGLLYFFKKKNIPYTPLGCATLSLFTFICIILYFIGKTNRLNEQIIKQKEADLVKVTLVSTGEIIKIPKDSLQGADTNFINKNNVYKNDTGKELVDYTVRYSKKNYNTDVPIGTLIKPNALFYWYNEKDYYMFQSPPNSVTFTVSNRNKNKIEFYYLHFLDYADKVKKDVRIINPTN